jgi:ABC-type transport system involved in multi-copper enzyme maturation permease subunit
MTTMTPITASHTSLFLAHALRSERIKLTTLRTTKVLCVLTAVINFAAAYATAKLVTDEVLTVAQVFVYPAVFTAVFAAVAGILMFTSEAHHGTLGVTFAAQPTRWVIAAAKAVVAIAVGITLGAVGMAGAAAGAAAGGLALGDGSAIAATTGWALLYAGAAATIGLGLGMTVRHSAGAISGLLVWWFVAENLLRTFTSPSIARFLPFDAGYRTLGVGSKFDTPEILAAALRRPQYAVVFVTYAVVTLAAGTVLLDRRDADA